MAPSSRDNNNSNNKKDGHHHHPITFPTINEPISGIDARIGRVQPSTMNKDGHHTQVHLHRPRDADLAESFCRDTLPADDVYVPAHHQPANPEDEDDMVPDQHAAFGIQRATGVALGAAARREPAWRDLGLGALMARGPEAGAWRGVGLLRRGVGMGGGVGGVGGVGGLGVGGAGGAMGGSNKGPSKMPR